MARDKSFNWTRVDPTKLNLQGHKVAIVGGTGGIGQALSRFMASRGAHVLVVGQTFRDSGHAGIEFIKADLSSMSEAKRVAGLLPAETLDMIIFTTGIFAAPQRQETKEGIEMDLAVSYLNRLVMLREIMPRLARDRSDTNRKVRVFIMGFPGTGQVGSFDDLNAVKSYKAMSVHMNTVAGNEILVLDSQKRFKAISFFGLNPGLIRTNIRSNFLGKKRFVFWLTESLIGLLTKSAETYAKRLTPLLVSSDLEGHSGMMFNDKAQAILPSKGLTDAQIKAFTKAAEKLVASKGIALAQE